MSEHEQLWPHLELAIQNKAASITTRHVAIQEKNFNICLQNFETINNNFVIQENILPQNTFLQIIYLQPKKSP